MTCIDDGSYVSAAKGQAAAIVSQAKIDVAIQTAVAVWNRSASKSISNMQTEIADEQVQLAEQLHEHAKKFWPAQVALVDDVFSITKLTNDYVALPAAWGGMLDETLTEGRADWLQTQQLTMCSTPSHCEDIRWDHNAALLRADMLSYSARQGEARVQILNDWRYEQQTAVLALGKNQVRHAVEYAEMRGRQAASVGGMLADGINTALSTFGYYQRRRLNEGWGQAISGSLRTIYAPAPEMQVRGAQTYPLAPMQPPAQVEQLPPTEITKDTEMQNIPDLRALRMGGYL